MEKAIPLRKRARRFVGGIFYHLKRIIPDAGDAFRVLVYHSITDKEVNNEWEENTTPKDLFERHMKYLVDNGYNVISCKDGIRYLMDSASIPSKTVSITFDDGYRNQYINALPILKKYDLPATLFLTVDFLRTQPNREEYINCPDIEEIRKFDIIDFGCHGSTHRILSSLNEEDLEQELKDSKEKLEDITKSEIKLLAYPFGHSKSYNERTIKMVKEAGFMGAYTTLSGLNGLKTNRFLLRRSRISWLDGLDEFEKHLRGAYDWCASFECFRHKRYGVPL